MNKKCHLILCEIHYPFIHGKTNSSDPNIETHYLVFDKYNPYTYLSYSVDNDDSDYDAIDMNTDIEYLSDYYRMEGFEFGHPTIRNYTNIITRQNYIKPEIAQCILLPTQEEIAILKTFWLRIIQRTWKKIVAERQQIILRRMYPDALHFRRVYGKWPEYCNYLPGLNGMLSNIV